MGLKIPLWSDEIKVSIFVVFSSYHFEMRVNCIISSEGDNLYVFMVRGG